MDFLTSFLGLVLQVLKYSQSDWNKMKQELELGFQAQLLAKEREWGCKLADRDSRLANEEVLKKCVADLQSKLKKAEQKVQVVKGQAEEKLEKATEEIEKVQKSSNSEIARLEAALRKAELHLQSQETLLEQKVKENKELAAICDELIAKVQ
nr:hypothetical protein BaRGS_032193 [Batillaria attramentaria]